MARIFSSQTGLRPPGWAIVRTGVATYFNGSGVLTTAAANSERVDYSPASGSALLGLLIEGAATNNVPGSSNMLAAPWSSASATLTAAPGIDGGTTSALTIAGTGQYANNHAACTKAGSTTYTVSGYVKKTTGAPYLSGFSFEPDSEYASAVDTNAGSIIAGTWGNGTVISRTISDAGNWWRVTETFKTASGTGSGNLYLAPPIANSSGARADRSGNGSTTWCSPQIEAGSVASSYIPTSSSGPANRSADAYSFSLSANATALTFTFDDGSTQTISGLTGGSTYTIPTSLNRSRVMYIDDNASADTTGGIIMPRRRQLILG